MPYRYPVAEARGLAVAVVLRSKMEAFWAFSAVLWSINFFAKNLLQREAALL
jgi:hypothetical protein